MKMTEEKARQLWMDYLSGTLEVGQQSLLMEFLNKHQDLHQELLEDERIWEQLSQIPTPVPSKLMDEKFEAQLQGYIMAQSTRKMGFEGLQPFFAWLAKGWQVGLVALVFGFGLAWLMPNSHADSDQLSALQVEMQDMKRMMMLTLIEQPKAQERIKAVSIARELPTADQKVINMLASTLNSDPNVNVRLAALSSLERYWKVPEARQVMIMAIGNQESPVVQSAIADTMLALREKSSVQELEKLLNGKTIDEGVKTKIELTIKKLKMI
ncbi:MAG: HEAT repeat domain-containing protein [Cyclobacteriaceae bacterium]|nr:HEAT repeat domain-containing protein [Cyclobacteriaceae bacterium HetDA_MAG_MS6]